MARNGSGTMIVNNSVYTGSTVFEQDRDAGTAISSPHVDYALQDMANEITNSLALDGQSSPTANISFNSKLLTSLGDATTLTGAMTLQQFQKGTAVWCGTSAGTANAQTLTTSPTFAAYTTGMRLLFKAGASNTGAMTLNVNAVGAAAVRFCEGTYVAKAGHIVLNSYYEVVYTGSVWLVLAGTSPFVMGIWAPTFTNLTTVTTGLADMKVEGDKVTCLLYATGTTSGASTIVSNLPHTSANTTNGPCGACLIIDGGSPIGGTYAITSNDTAITFRRWDGAAFGSGASRTVSATIIYEIKPT